MPSEPSFIVRLDLLFTVGTLVTCPMLPKALFSAFVAKQSLIKRAAGWRCLKWDAFTCAAVHRRLPIQRTPNTQRRQVADLTYITMVPPRSERLEICMFHILLLPRSATIPNFSNGTLQFSYTHHRPAASTSSIPFTVRCYVGRYKLNGRRTPRPSSLRTTPRQNITLDSFNGTHRADAEPT